MDETKPKRRSKVSYRPPKDFEAEFDALATLSGLSTNAFITDCIKQAKHGNHKNKAVEIKLATIIDDLAHIKAAAIDNDITSEDLTHEITLLRTVAMRLWGQRL